MDENEKKLIQAQHRLEEAQARDRVKERKARTRVLIQKGAILEKTMPKTNGMSLEELEAITRGDYTMDSKYGPKGNAGAFAGILPSLQEKGIPAEFIHVQSLEQAKSLPCVFNNWAVFYGGKFVTVNQLDAAGIEKLLKKK